MKDYHKFIFDTESELLIARLYALDFDSFQELDGQTEAYILSEMINDDLIAEMTSVANDLNINFTQEKHENKNWNEIWESNFDPVHVSDFCTVRADFHEKNESVQHDIIINPKMAFGTGHHETTYMMIESMRDLDFVDKKVFDYGCGTAVLAILAHKLGSRDILAIDIEEEAAANSLENCTVNSIEGIDVRQAILSDVDDSTYDIILANINRQVLLDSANRLNQLISPSGILLISGILEQDKDIVMQAYQDAGWQHTSTKQRGNWLCMAWSKI